ncbi:CHAT domain-containing protein [Streptomyces sp. NPDC048278]|uniref:CHAT domain-containing protein n=1 Tax=Streptomyces sp. NPDC048278 TaxID=3155809 RepID=UPI00342E8316
MTEWGDFMAVSDERDEVLDALIGLVRDVHAGHLGEDAADQYIRSAPWQVDEEQVLHLVGFGLHRVRDGATVMGYLMARLLMALSEERWGRGMSSPWWQAADLLVEAVRLDLVERPSGRRLRLACAVADEQLETLRQARELDELAETMYAAGILRVHPHIAAPALDDGLAIRDRQLRGQVRGRMFGAGSAGPDPDSLDALPHPVDAALEALPYLYGAAGLSEGHQRARCLNAVNEALAILMDDSEAGDWVTDSWLANSRSAAALIDPVRDPVNAIRLRRILAIYDGRLGPDSLQELLPKPLPELVRLLGERETWGVMHQALPLLRETGRRDLLRELLAAVHAELPVPRDRSGLWEVWQSHLHALPGDPAPCPAEDTEAEIKRAFRDALTPEHQGTATLLYLAAHLHQSGAARATCALLDALPDYLPDAGPQVARAVRCLLGSASAAAAAEHQRAGELFEAIDRHATAARHYSALGLQSLVLREMELMVDCADAGGTDEVTRAVVALRVGIAPRLEAGLDEPAAFALVAAAQKLGSRTTEGRQSGAAMLMLHEAAKGVDFSRALETPGPRRPLPQLTERRERIEELASRLGEAAPPRLSEVGEDLEMLSYAGTQEHAAGDTEHEKLGNLRRSFDRDLSGSLYPPAPAETPSAYPDLDDVVAALPDETVLVSLWIAQQPRAIEPAGPDGQPAAALHLLTVTSQGIQDIRVQPFAGMPGAVLQLSRDGYRQTMHPFAYEVASARSVARADPLHREVTRVGEEELDFGSFFGNLDSVLARLHSEGRRHLCFWAHGPFHYLPFPLLRRAGRPLADDWTVTTVPSPVCVTGPRTPATPSGTGLVSLGAALGGTPWGLRGEPVLDEHAAAVAAVADGITLVGPDATPAAFLSRAEGARYVHVAAHGAHSQDASWFQCLYLNPPEGGGDGRLFGHEVLLHDLRGVDLVTLAACESALGRFDLADNPRGLPTAFLLAGARAVVGCLWPVRTPTATRFFGELYTRLADHQDTLRAFREAQTATRARFPQYRDWGALTYHGGWLRPDRRNP